MMSKNINITYFEFLFNKKLGINYQIRNIYKFYFQQQEIFLVDVMFIKYYDFERIN